MHHKDHARLAMLERFGLITSLIVAFLIVIAGCYMARTRCDPHWLNRSGAAIVAIQAVAAVLEMGRRRRLVEVARLASPMLGQKHATGAPAETGSDFLNDEIERSERNAFAVVIFLAAFGEVLHGFGDLLFEVVR